jgi:hypothetical protein
LPAIAKILSISDMVEAPCGQGSFLFFFSGILVSVTPTKA